MTLMELAVGTDLVIPQGAETLAIDRIVSDSRSVQAGDLFVCLRGKTADGHDFVTEAVGRGAAAVVTDRDYPGQVPAPAVWVRCGNTRAALAYLWNNYYGRPAEHMKLVAVTGTNGKTSVTFMLRAIFGAALIKTGLIGTVDCYAGDRKLNIRAPDERANMTTPDPRELYQMLAVMAEEGVEVVFLEASSHALALDKLAPLRMTEALFTNLTPEHLDFHGTMEAYLAAKQKLFGMTENAVILSDNAYAGQIAAYAAAAGCRNIRLCTADENGEADYAALHIKNRGVDGMEYVLSSVCSVFKIRSPIPGYFTVANTLLAAACALEMGISPSTVQDALRHMRGVNGRFERVKLCAGADFSVFIDYAHTPDALENVLRTARGFRARGQRIVLLFGCGGDRDRTKRAVMGRIASELADFVIVTSDNSRGENPRDIIADILTGFDYTRARATVIEDRARAIDYAIRNALQGDILLLTGKGHETYEIDRNGKHPFHERQLVQEAARLYYDLAESGGTEG